MEASGEAGGWGARVQCRVDRGAEPGEGKMTSTKTALEHVVRELAALEDSKMRQANERQTTITA